MSKSKTSLGFGKHKANVRKLSAALTGYGTVYMDPAGKPCGLISPTMDALEQAFRKLATGPFSKSKVRKVILFERKHASVIKAAR